MFGNEPGVSDYANIKHPVTITLAQACEAVDEASEQHGRMRILLGSALFGALHSLHLRPENSDEQQATWLIAQQILRVPQTEVEAAKLIGEEVPLKYATTVARTLHPLARTPRNEMGYRFTHELAFMFGKNNVSELTPTEVLTCLHAGFALTTVWEDAQAVNNHVLTERLNIAATYQAVTLIIAVRLIYS